VDVSKESTDKHDLSLNILEGSYAEH
jgi:hypothetical protein